MRIMTFCADLMSSVLMVSHRRNVFLQMALIAQFRLRRLLKVHVFGSMEIVAKHTVPCRYWTMQITTGSAIVRMTGITEVRQGLSHSRSVPTALFEVALLAIFAGFVSGNAGLPSGLFVCKSKSRRFLNGRFSTGWVAVTIQRRHTLEEKGQNLVPARAVATGEHGRKYTGKYD